MKEKQGRTPMAAATAALAALLAATLAVVPAGARPGPGISVRADFDNSFVHVSRPGERHIEIEVFAPAGPGGRHLERPPLNIALVIDKSGSMAEAGKMEYARKAALEMTEHLRYGDRLSVIAYDDEVQVLAAGEAVEDSRRLRRLIGRLYPGGATNLGAGMIEGYGQVRRHFVPGGVNRVILLSDGLANRGIPTPHPLTGIEQREGSRGISLSTFGVGLDFNEDLLASLAEGGRGTYYYIDSPERTPEILARELGSIEQVVALDVTVTIEIEPRFVLRDIMGYEYSRERNRYRVRVGDLSAGERRTIMARIETADLPEGDHTVGRVEMEYQSRGDEKVRRTVGDLRLQYVRDRAVVEEKRNLEITERSAVFGANRARQEAARLVDDGDLEGAREVLDSSRKKLKDAPVRSEAVMDELKETESYQSAIEAPMSPAEKSSVQKGVKYRAYQVLQSR